MPALIIGTDALAAIVWLAVYVVVVVGYVYRDALLLLLGGMVHVLLALLMAVPAPSPVHGSVLLVLVALGVVHIAQGVRLAFGGRRR